MTYCRHCGTQCWNGAKFCPHCGAPLPRERALLKLTNIKKDYKVASGAVHALKGVSLEFRKSEFVCVLGQSGCGKTTLLNIIGGLDKYTSGDLTIQGKSTKKYKSRDWDVYRNHRIGFIFQTYNLIPHQTVLGNVELALTIAGIGKAERRRRAKRALERVGLAGEIDKRPNQLSGGQMQRVAIARAIVNNPDILLADEPTGALDSKTSVEVMELIKEIAKEKLVIMVTHNGELAEQYASRIVRLKDGLVESDSDPYIGNAGNAPQEAKKTKERAKMSFGMALALSFRNLLTKKGRTFLTSAAGSIGIISVCLVLALSSGFNAYIRHTEEDMLSYYPLHISESTFDISSVMNAMNSTADMPDLSELQDKVYINSFLTGLARGMSVTNNLSDKYLEYIEDIDPALVYAVQYNYGATIGDNLFMEVDWGNIKYTDKVLGETVSPEETRYYSVSQLTEDYLNELQTKTDNEYASLLPYTSMFTDVVNKMPGTDDFAAGDYAEYVLSQYDVIEGTFPKNIHEAVLVVGSNNEILDMTVAQLGMISEEQFISPFIVGTEDDERTSKLDFADIVGKKYVLYGNDAVYTKNADYYGFMSSMAGGYPFNYKGQRDDLAVNGEEGIEITVSGILRLKSNFTYGCLTEGLNLTEATVEEYIAMNKESEIVKWLSEEEGKVPSQLFDPDRLEQLGITVPDSYLPYLEQLRNANCYFSPCSHLNENYTDFGMFYVTFMPDSVIRTVGGSDRPMQISLYPRDFDAKEDLLAYLDAWNDTCEEQDRITYNDTVGILMGMMQTILDVITYVLVAFTAISLIVSSVMIGIITYVSVVERIKEIGVLRSLGARKKDIRNLFNAETFIIGLTAGLIGIGVSYLLSWIISLIIFSLSGIAGIATLPPLTAFIMVVVSVVLTLISGLIPAQAAARKDPVIALRTE